MNLISLEKINKTYGKGENRTPALRDINLTVKKGEFIAIMGASGSGKTTLMNIIGLLDRPDTGNYYLDDKHTNRLKDRAQAALRRQTIGFVFQNFNLLSRLTARANVELPMMYNHLNRRHRKILAAKLLRVVGLGNRINHKPTQLSGGQMQRVAIARSLANQPELILADEPTGNLDSRTGKVIINIFKKLNLRGHTIIVVTHDPEVAEQAHRHIVLKDGRIVKSVATQTPKKDAKPRSRKNSKVTSKTKRKIA